MTEIKKQNKKKNAHKPQMSSLRINLLSLRHKNTIKANELQSKVLAFH